MKAASGGTCFAEAALWCILNKDLIHLYLRNFFQVTVDFFITQ